MSTEHFVICETCQTQLAIGKLIYRRPDLDLPLAAAEWLSEMQAVVAFLADHITHLAAGRHVLIVTDLDYLFEAAWARDHPPADA
jgi:hypothetical protein